MDRGSQKHLWINRKHQRARTDLPCKLYFQDGGSTSARIVNLSAGGLKFCCGRDEYLRILPEDQRMLGQVSGVEIGIRFQFQCAHDHVTKIQASVSVIHIERLAQDKYHVGTQYTDLDTAKARALEKYIEECKARYQL